jgi:hypothetical protein
MDPINRKERRSGAVPGAHTPNAQHSSSHRGQHIPVLTPQHTPSPQLRIVTPTVRRARLDPSDRRLQTSLQRKQRSIPRREDSNATTPTCRPRHRHVRHPSPITKPSTVPLTPTSRPPVSPQPVEPGSTPLSYNVQQGS